MSHASFKLTTASLSTFAFMLSACSTWQNPPAHLTANQDVMVKFKSSRQASNSCSEIHEAIRGKKNGNIKACAYRKTAEADPVVIIPNPCEFDDIYATLLCHELGHINQMALGQMLDHAGWDGPLKSSTKKKVAMVEAEVSELDLPEFEAVNKKRVVKKEAEIPTLRGFIQASFSTDSKGTAARASLSHAP